MSSTNLMLMLLMGFTGSLHCAGMCGPIIWIMPFQFLKGFRKALSIALYHLGRITTYALLAMILRSFSNLFNPQVQQYVSIGLGITLLLAGIISFIPLKKASIKLPWTDYVKHKLGSFISRPAPDSLFIAGFLNGLLPCGLVYMALSAAATAPGTLQAMELMYVFGLGTVPMLVGLTLLKGRMNLHHIARLRKMVPVTMLVLGSILVVRGMNLGIPYLSPKVEMQHHIVKASCCHRH